MDMLKKTQQKITVIIPVYHPDRKFLQLLQSLVTQTVTYKLLIIDSGDSESFYGEYLECLPAIIKHIKQEDFNHGGTRQMGMDMCPNTDIFVFLTQDAILASNDAVEKLVDIFQNEKIGCAYGRQLPHKGAGIFASHARAFNYPNESYVRSYEDKEKYGIKTVFISNSFASYRREAVYQAGGFPRNIILSEDMYLAAKMLKAGWQIAYVAEAKVYHSHDYGVWREFERYFDIGTFHAQESWIQKEFGRVEGEGKRFVLSEARLVSEKNPLLLIEVMVRNVMKFLGYRLGTTRRYWHPSQRHTYGVWKA